MLPVKHTVIYTFFAITSVQNTCFCSVFNALASKNTAKSCYVPCFFHFWPFFHCRKATKMTQNSISIPSCAQTPKNPRKMSKTPPNSGLGAKPFLAPPAKADIATAILTNVIEHLVLLFCPPISTPSPPKRCGRIYGALRHHMASIFSDQVHPTGIRSLPAAASQLPHPQRDPGGNPRSAVAGTFSLQTVSRKSQGENSGIPEILFSSSVQSS